MVVRWVGGHPRVCVLEALHQVACAKLRGAAMWWAGVGWRDGDFEVAVVDESGDEVVPPTEFSGREIPALLRLLTECAGRAGGDLRTVIDSTNGILDSRLIAVGLPVYRADPPA